MSDGRTGKRFSLQLPISINASESSNELVGTTDNLSVAGVYLHAKGDFKVGSKVNFQITLPADMTGAESDVKIQCTGTVVRTDEQTEAEGPTGIACVIDGYEFVRP